MTWIRVPLDEAGAVQLVSPSASLAEIRARPGDRHADFDPRGDGPAIEGGGPDLNVVRLGGNPDAFAALVARRRAAARGA